jgi:predicted permease
MNVFLTFWRRFRSLGQRREVKREIDEELRFHLEQRTIENVNAGMPPEDAAREANKRFGNLQSVREECQDARGTTFGETMWQDIRFGLRMLRKNPGFTLVAVMTLALGIGANTTMFSLVNAILFQPLPFPEADRLVRLYRISSASPRDGLSIGVFEDVREQNTVFEHVAAYYPEWPYNMAKPGEPADLLSGLLVTADFFAALGIQPELGRGFTAEEDEPGRDDVIVLSHRFWEQRFHGDRNIIGSTVRLDGRNVTIVGVMPERFHNLLWHRVDLVHPFAFGSEQRQKRGDNWRFAFGRLKPGATIAQADAELKTMAGRFARDYPRSEQGYGLRALSLRESLSENDGPIMWFSLGLAGFVLLLACANLANLLLARLAARSRELAVRAALGAGRARLLRQLLAESFLLALIGGAIGVAWAAWAKDFIGSRLTVVGETGLPVPLDLRVLGFALASCVLASLLAGTAPAWFAVRKDVNRQLTERRGNLGGTPPRWRHLLIVGEVALALVLLTGAGLFMHSITQLAQRDPGWRVDGLMSTELFLTSSKYKSPEACRLFFDELGSRLSALPGVQSVAFSSRPPMLTSRFHRSIAFEGRPPASPGQHFFAGFEPVSLGYFATIGIQLKEGRFFTGADSSGQPSVAIINETMARSCWPNESPLGKRIGDADSENPGWAEIVGVVSDVRLTERGGQAQPQVYRPLAQEPPIYAAAEWRYTGAPEAIAAAVRRTVAAIDPDQSTYKIQTAREFIRGELRALSLLGGVLAAFAGLGLGLAAIGIYGVVSYTVERRTSEIGVRMALGARRGNVLWLVLREGLALSLVGALLGSAGAWGVARLLAGILPFPVAANALGLGAVALFLVSVALLACFIPARRASRIDPMTALRYE